MKYTSNQDCPKGHTRLPDGQVVTKQEAHAMGYTVPGYSARVNRDQAMKDLGLTKVRGARGGTYYE
jgi:hypothetical protein